MDLLGNFNVLDLIRSTVQGAAREKVDLVEMRNDLDEGYVRAMQYVCNMFVKSRVAVDGIYGHITDGLFKSVGDMLGIDPHEWTQQSSERLIEASGLDPSTELPRDPHNQHIHPDIPEARHAPTPRRYR